MSKKKRLRVVPVETYWPHLREPDRRVLLLPPLKGGGKGRGYWRK